MFEELTLQIKHQYGKYLSFNNAYKDSSSWFYDHKVYGMNKGYFEDETIVRFIPKKGGYQIKHQYGKYLTFNNAYTKSKEDVFGMNQGFYEDETIVHLIPKDDGYQIKHQYGKYLTFNNAYTKSKEYVFGMSQGYCEDETIVYLIPINYNFLITIEDFQYDTTGVHDAQLNGQIQHASLINKTFCNDSNNNQKFSINESVAFNVTSTFEHSTTNVTKWLNEISVGVRIMAEGKVPLPLVTNGSIVGEKSFGYKYSWGTESTEQFSTSTTKSITQTINVTDEITVSPKSKMTYKCFKNQLSGIAVPYRAVMKIKCEMDGIFVSDQALEFILNHIGSCPNGSFAIKNGHGIYSTRLTGEITLDNVALNHSTDLHEQPL